MTALRSDRRGPATVNTNQLRRPPELWRVFLGLAIVAAAVRVFVPAPSGITALIGSLGLASVVRGAVQRHGGSRGSNRSWWREPWTLIALGLAPLVAGEALRVLVPHLAGFPTWLDWVEMAGCPMTVAGLLGLISHEVRERSVDSLFLATIGPLVVGFAAWLLLAERAAHTPMNPAHTALALLFATGNGVALAMAGRTGPLARRGGVSPPHPVACVSCLP